MPGLERFGRRGIFDFELDARADLIHFPVVENLGNVALLLLSQRPTNLCRRPQSTPQFPGRRETVTDQIDVLWSTRSEEHTSELQSLMRISYAVFCWKNKK